MTLDLPDNNEQPSEPMDQQEVVASWLEDEAKELEKTTIASGERLPSLKLEEKKLTEFEIDFANEFPIWTADDGTVKAIIPVIHAKEKKNLWLNKKNPLYATLVNAGRTGQTKFKVFTTGTQHNTRYELVE